MMSKTALEQVRDAIADLQKYSNEAQAEALALRADPHTVIDSHRLGYAEGRAIAFSTAAIRLRRIVAPVSLRKP